MSTQLYGGPFDGAEMRTVTGASTLWVRRDPDRTGRYGLVASKYHRAGAVQYRFVGTVGETCVYCYSRIANGSVILPRQEDSTYEQ